MKAMAGHDGFPSGFARGEKQEWKLDGQWKSRFPSRGCVMGWPCRTSLFFQLHHIPSIKMISILLDVLHFYSSFFITGPSFPGGSILVNGLDFPRGRAKAR